MPAGAPERTACALCGRVPSLYRERRRCPPLPTVIDPAAMKRATAGIGTCDVCGLEPARWHGPAGRLCDACYRREVRAGSAGAMGRRRRRETDESDTMTGDEMTFRTDLRLRAGIESLVAQGAYESMEAFMNEAIRLRLQFDGISFDGEPPGPDPMVVFLKSPRGRALMRELVREELGG